MATNLRAISLTAVNNTLLRVLFTDSLNPNIDVENITFVSQTAGVPDPLALDVRVINDVLEITTQPLTSLAGYVIVFNSTITIPFHSLNNTSILFEDGVANKLFFIGPIEPTNIVKEYFLNYLRENVYNLESGSVLSNYLDTLSTVLSTALFNVRQARNENYLSITVTDEVKTRGATAFDHLDQEGAFEVIRVGRTPTNTISNMTISVDNFTTDPISLLKATLSDTLSVSSVDKVGIFNINSFTMTLSKRFVIKLSSVTFTYTNGHLPYVYDIDTFGYQILDPKYDTNVAFPYLLLDDNQIRLSDKILEDPNFSSHHIFHIQVEYEYKDTGRTINQNTIAVEDVLGSGREVLPPLRNVFNLKHGPIVTVNNDIGTLGNISFVDQNSLAILQAAHPAFQRELPFRLDFLPSNLGEYSVDYATGTVYVYGATISNDGTGATPPLAIYKYRIDYKENIDWVIDPDSNDLAVLPTGGLIDIAATISFNFEQVLAQDIDYKAHLHQEVLEERITNNLIALNAFTVENAPITNVFRIFNETSGEIYRLIRWVNNKVFFAYTTPPNIAEIVGERASFELINNEVMFVRDVFDTISPSIKVFYIVLNNNNIMAQSEDCIGSSFNSTASFSDNSIFARQLYFDPLETQAVNLERLTIVGDYLFDHINGVVYVTVLASQDVEVGSVSYKRGYIKPLQPHLTSVEDIYYRINTLSAKDKTFKYTQFDDGFILPTSFDVADEQVLTGDVGEPYIVSSNKIGALVDAVFINTVSDRIQFIRHIYANDDLLNNYSPINFAAGATFTGKAITIAPLVYKEYHSVEFNGIDHFITLNTGLQYLSSEVTLTISVVRLSDSQQLWNGSGIVVLGSLMSLTLPGIGSPVLGDSVLVTYTFAINDLTHVIVDYNKGEYYIDYSALTDEIIVSYEYGNNELDFRESSALSADDIYYVTYKAGALRDALLKNFGSLIDIPILNTFDVTFSRERYRDAITAAMHSFAQGPTVAAIKNIATIISHLPAEVNESIFESWSLGHSLLSPQEYATTGTLALVPTRHGDGVLINQADQSIVLPSTFNVKLEEGTFETWIRPEWDGLDNLAELKITPFKDGYVMSELDIFVGALEYHPTLQTDATGTFFTLDKTQSVDGVPNKNKDGVYVYYDNDVTNSFKRWFIEIIDGYANDFTDGYLLPLIDGYVNKKYSLNISTNGRFYDLKSTINPQPSTTRITSGTNKAIFAVTSIFPNEGITFVADIPHYILDVGYKENQNRLSVFKDESGYINFKVFDSLANSYIVSTNVSNWRHGDLHHVAVSWKLNTTMGRDELHLFIDGFEVPNILRYGDRIKPYLHEKFRTVNPEEIVGIIESNITAGNDLVTLLGSDQVTSSFNFSQYGIQIGDTIYIEEPGFNVAGYSILNVNGNTLTLTATMPFTITDGKFSVNKTDLNVSTEIDIFPNFAVAVIHTYFEATDLTTFITSNVLHSSSTNFITRGVQIGDLVRIDNPAFEKFYTILQFTAHTLTVNADMPISLSGLSFTLYHNTEEEIPGLRALHPAYELSKSTDGKFTNILTIRDLAQTDDLVLIRTLGLNHRRVRRRYYVWSDQQHILKTHLPAPISLDATQIYKVLLPSTFIGPGNATLILGVFHSNNIPLTLLSNATGGRTISVSIKGDNINFTTPVTVVITGSKINGVGTVTPTTETLTFTEPGVQDTTNLFVIADHINVTCKPINSSLNCAVVEVKEKNSLTVIENTTLFNTDADSIQQPIVRYSYQVSVGNTLSSDGYQAADGYVVTDVNNFFSSNVVDNYLSITSPFNVVGFYKITDVSADHHSLSLISTEAFPLPLTAFSDGYYQILHTTDFRSGLQNGYFTFEHADMPGDPYLLTGGWYELDYYTYLQIPFDLTRSNIYFGSDFVGLHQLYGSMDESQILNVKLTDTRIGETAPNTQRTITKEFNSVKASKPDINSLVLTHFDTLPPTNQANVYRTAERNIMQAGNVINDNFTQSIVFTGKPLIMDNDGILDTRKAGTIEFWINPIFDTANDPNFRFYFDAFGAVTEELVSINNTTIQLRGTASQILGVKTKIHSQDVDFFAGGELTNSGTILNLHRALPNQNTTVLVTYLPLGLQGDRISLYKDTVGYFNFNIRADNTDYNVRVPIFWARNTWHRVKATYTVNNKALDELHLFLDGYEYNDVLYGNGLLFGQGLVYGSTFAGPAVTTHDIRFKDAINQITIGADYIGGNAAYCLMDNLRVSNISRPLYQPFGEPLDPNYSSNLDMVFPITEDLNTTLLLNFDTLVTKNTDFAILNSSNTDQFSVNILNSFGILESDKVKSVLEELIKSFKPATSTAIIRYI